MGEGETRAKKALDTENAFVVLLDEPCFGGARHLVVTEKDCKRLWAGQMLLACHLNLIVNQ